MSAINKEGATLFRFMLVGVVNAIVGTGTMFLLYNLADCSYWFSSVSNYVVGGICSFVLNKYFTFQNKERSWAQVFKFVATVSLCYFVSYGVAKPLAIYVLSSYSVKVQENIAMCIGMCLYVLSNYLIQRLFVFNEK